MSPRAARNATSLLAAAAIAAIVALLVIGATSGPRSAAASGCGAAGERTYLDAAFTVARDINTGEHIGAGVRRALRTIEHDRFLIDAVAAGQLAAIRQEVLALVFNHEHIVRLRILRHGRVLVDVGGPLVLARNVGTLRRRGRVVGTFVMSVQDDAGYRKLAERLVGARVVMRYGGATVMSDIATAGARLPVRGAVTLAGARYLVGSFSDARFPTGTLHIWLLFAAPRASLARPSCGQIVANVLADVARRAYEESLNGPPVVPARTTLALDQALPQALAAADYAGAAKIVAGMVSGGGFARLRVSVGRRLVADAGGRAPAVAPLAQAIRDASGAIVGHAAFAVQNALGYTILARALTDADVLVRSGSRQLAGDIAGPAKLPDSGPVRYRGRRYYVASFAGTAFPSGAIRIYVLAPS